MAEDEFRTRFVELLLKHKEVIFSKSQLPEMRRKKAAMLTEIGRQCKDILGVNMSRNQIQKKIINLKCRLKAKADALQSGNKLVALKKYEFQLLDLWNVPLMYNIQGNEIVTPDSGVSTATRDLHFDSQSSSEAGPSTGPDPVARPDSPEPQLMKKKLGDLENEMSCDLTVTELHKHVLLKKFKLLEAQERKLKVEEEKAAKHNSLLAMIERIAMKREKLLDLQLHKAMQKKGN